MARLLTLDPDTIVTTALRVARAEGLASLSMRRLAVELKVSAMAMYRHVADREELLLRMLDVVADEVDPPAATDSPRERITHVLTELHRVFRQDTWVVQVLATEGLASPRILPAMEAMYAAQVLAVLGPPATGRRLGQRGRGRRRGVPDARRLRGDVDRRQHGQHGPVPAHLGRH